MDNPRNPTIIKTDKLYKKQLDKEHVSREHVKYITYRNNFARIKRKQREIYYGNLFQQYKSNIKKTWSTLNEILNRKKNEKKHQYQIHSK